MRQQRTYGSVRGALSDGRPYRDLSYRYHEGIRLRTSEYFQRRVWLFSDRAGYSAGSCVLGRRQR
jgi:hypothetical protein